MKIGPGVSELWGVENRPLPLTRPMAYTTACTCVQAMIPNTKHCHLSHQFQFKLQHTYQRHDVAYLC